MTAHLPQNALSLFLHLPRHNPASHMFLLVPLRLDPDLRSQAHRYRVSLHTTNLAEAAKPTPQRCDPRTAIILIGRIPSGFWVAEQVEMRVPSIRPRLRTLLAKTKCLSFGYESLVSFTSRFTIRRLHLLTSL